MKNRPKKKNETLKTTVSILMGFALIALAAYGNYKHNRQQSLPVKEPESIDELLAALEEAVKQEDYEAAAIIRDQINKLKNKQHGHQPTNVY